MTKMIPPKTDDAARTSTELRFAAIVSILYMAVLAVVIARHEMWRDEIDAWLVVRDSASLLDVFHSIRYGGHPALWYLLLWVPSRLGLGLAAMQAVNALVAGAAAFLVLRFAPGPRWMRAAWVFGYFPLYEYGVIARNYALSLLALAAIAWAFPHRRRRPILIGALVAVSAQTTPHGVLLALALVTALAVELALRPPARGAPRAGAWAGVVVACAGIALTIWQVRPPADGGYAETWFLRADAARAGEALASVTDGYLPVPRPGPGYWQTNAIASALSPSGRAVAGAVLLLAAAAALSAAPMAALTFGIASSGLLAFNYLKFQGYLRHHGYLWLALGFAAWIAAAEPAGATSGRRLLLRRAATIAFAALLALHVAGASVAVAGDLRYRFSAAKATAELMRVTGVDTLPLAGGWDYTAEAVVGYLDARRAFYLNGRRFGSYIVFDRARTGFMDAWSAADEFVARAGAPVAVLLDAVVLREQPPPDRLAARVSRVGCVLSEVVADESYCVFVLLPREAPAGDPTRGPGD